MERHIPSTRMRMETTKMIKNELRISPLPFWIKQQLHRPCWKLSRIINAMFSDKKERRIINHIKKQTGASKVILTDSGSSAIELALKRLAEISPNKEVIMPSYCCKTVADSIINCGLIPHFVDVADDFMVLIENVTPAVNKNTLAIIAPHMYGKDGLFYYIKMAFPTIPLIEDKAMRVQGRLRGDYGILSFNIGKQIQSTGGGALLIK